MVGTQDNLRQVGSVVWITGLSGVGKTTIAGQLQRRLSESGIQAVVLDGDRFREAVADSSCGYDPASRLVNAYRISRFARMIAAQGIVTVVATVSMFHEVRAWNRKHLSPYLEVHVKVDRDILIARDAKRLYVRAERGEEQVVGVQLPAEEPADPDLVCSNSGPMESVGEIVDAICARLNKW
jgi:adenylylsulfate kinase-like enzyme